VADTSKAESYQGSIEEMIDKGYAAKVPADELQRSDGAVWYLHHHGVTSEHKPGKLRVVFDCAAKFSNVSLNEHVLQGPDLTKKLDGVLIRFRQDPIAPMADIESMFHQVQVTPCDWDVLRFLWWLEGDLGQHLEEYRMTVHLFGGVWKRMIRSVHKVLASIVKEQVLSDEVLLTVMCEAEATVNSCPMTPVSDDPQDMNPLTPNHLLLLRDSSSVSIREFTARDTYRRRWRQAQYLADTFWRRSLREYLPALQYRHRCKRQEPRRNFKIDDVVILIDDSLPRNCWSLGRVVEMFPERDGLVRSLRIKTSTSEHTRPISKICLLEARDT